jgi:hypothetical protein
MGLISPLEGIVYLRIRSKCKAIIVESEFVWPIQASALKHRLVEAGVTVKLQQCFTEQICWEQ